MGWWCWVCGLRVDGWNAVEGRRATLGMHARIVSEDVYSQGRPFGHSQIARKEHWRRQRRRINQAGIAKIVCGDCLTLWTQYTAVVTEDC